MKKKTYFDKALLFVSIMIYIVFAYIIAQSIYVFRNFYRREETAYIQKLQSEIHTALKKENWQEELDRLKKKSALEIIIHDSEGKRIYSTIELAPDAKMKGVVNDHAKFLESFEQVKIDGQQYMLWYVIYQVPFANILENFVLKFSALILLVYVALVGIIIWLQRKLLVPLSKISSSLEKAERDEIDEKVLDEAEDPLNERLKNFFLKQKQTITTVYGKNTNLELELALEREHLENTINLSKAMVHDLKGPLHNQLLESEMKLMQEQQEEKQDFLKEEIQTYHKLLLEINDILRVLREDIYRIDDGSDSFDLVELVRTSQLHQMAEMNQKNLGFFFDGPEQAVIYQNKVAMQLLLHNISSNMAHYALEDSELEISLEVKPEEIILTFENTAHEWHLQNIRESNEHPQFVVKPSRENAYSSGNGLHLIKDLAKFLRGSCEYSIKENLVLTVLTIPSKETSNEA